MGQYVAVRQRARGAWARESGSDVRDSQAKEAGVPSEFELDLDGRRPPQTDSAGEGMLLEDSLLGRRSKQEATEAHERSNSK